MNREELIKEANTLGIEFQKNIKTTKLQELVDNANGVEKTVKPVENKPLSKNAFIAQRKKECFKTKKVRISNLDKRENDKATTVTLGFENPYFGLSRIVPLDVPVELEQGLINTAKEIKMIVHQEEVVKGELSGISKPRLTNKYSVIEVDNEL